MSIKFKVGQVVTFRVEGEYREGEKVEKFDFKLTATRSDQDEVSTLFASESGVLVVDFLAEKVTGWAGPIDEEGAPVPYSEDNFRALLRDYPGSGQLAFNAYIDAIGVKGRRKN